MKEQRMKTRTILREVEVASYLMADRSRIELDVETALWRYGETERDNEELKMRWMRMVD